MRNFFARDLWLLLLLVAAGGYLCHQYTTRYIPCVTPIHYALASFDARFPISKAALQRDIDNATKVWNEAIGKEIFIPSATSSAELPIYLVYDSRQATENRVASIDATITQKKAQLNALAAQYDAARAAFEQSRAKGRATQAELDALNTLAAQYEQLRLSVNADIAKYNHTIPQDEYNEARYVRDQEGTRIYIYSFSDNTSLQRVLEHELGHAIGLEHVAGEQSIMYPVNSGRNFDLSDEDRAELERVCANPPPFLRIGSFSM